MAYRKLHNISDFAIACDGLNLNNEIALIKITPSNSAEVCYDLMDFSLYKDNTKLFTLFFVEKGELTITMNYSKYVIGSNTLFSTPPSAMLNEITTSNDIEARMIIASAEYLKEMFIYKTPISLSQALALRQSEHAGVKLSNVDYITMRKALENLEVQMNREGHRFRKELVYSATATIIYEILNTIFNVKGESLLQAQKPSSTDVFVIKFVSLLGTYGNKEHNPSFYADKLCITVQYLSLILKRLSGHTTNDWIADHLITRAKIMLRNSSLTIQQVAAELYFSDQSSFGKFFKKHTGTTPKQYREEFLGY